MVLEARAGLRCVETIGRQVGCHRNGTPSWVTILGLLSLCQSVVAATSSSWLSFVVYVLTPLHVACGSDLVGYRPSLTLQMIYPGSV